MPITYTVDPARRLVFSTWTGTVTAAEIAALWRAYEADPEFSRCDGTLADVRKADPAFTGGELAGLLTSIFVPLVAGRPFAAAVLVATPVQYGSARQHGVFAPYSTNIFYDYDAAVAWLEAQVNARGPGSGKAVP